MASRGSQLSRAVDFFRNGNLDEARVALTLVNEVMEQRLTEERHKTAQPALPFNRKTRKRKPKSNVTIVEHPEAQVALEANQAAPVA